MGQVKVGLEQGGRRGRYGEKRDLSKSGRCCAEGRGAEEAILMQGRNQVLEVGREGSGKEKRKGRDDGRHGAMEQIR